MRFLQNHATTKHETLCIDNVHCYKSWSAQLGNWLVHKCEQVVSKLWHLECPSWETAWKCTHVPKPVPNLCMSCVQAWALLVHWSYCLDTPCTLELLLGHSLYTTQVLLGHSLYTKATAWAFLVHYTGTAWILLAHYTGTTWVLLVHIQYNIWALLVHYRDTVLVLLAH